MLSYTREIWIRVKTDITPKYRANFIDREIHEPSSISEDRST